MPGRPCIERVGPLLPAVQWVNLREVILQPGAAPEEARFQALMEAHHYLGALPEIGHPLWYVASWHGQWLALLSFSAVAWKCAARDAWTGWDFRHAYGRLHLIANNSRLLILPEHHYPNLASRVLAVDWRALRLPAAVAGDLRRSTVFPRHPLPRRQLALCGRHPWLSPHPGGLQRRAPGGQARFCPPLARPRPSPAVASYPRPHVLSRSPQNHVERRPDVSLSDGFADIPDPRRGQGRRHPLPTVPAIAAGAILCGMRGYKAISLWAQDLSQQARARFRCRYRVPSRTVMREVLTRVDPDALSSAVQRWNLQHADDEALAIDGKTLCHAIDDEGRQTPILGVVGHQSQTCYTQKSRRVARRRPRRSQANQRDRDGHPGP